ncbi:MAG: hypothetical protein NTU62_04565 [Spirochaetes bacterium]|nr:hypothetical protein [Spirochaetota bacterium]
MRSTRRLPAAIAFVLVIAAGIPASAQEAGPVPLTGSNSPFEIPEDLSPEAGNLPLMSEVPADALRYDDNGFPESPRGLLVVGPDPAGYSVLMRGVEFPFLLYAQFANRQRDAVFLARDGMVQDPLPDGSLVNIPYGYGALKTTTAYISVVEGLVLPHVSDNQKAYQRFPLRDVYLGASLGVTGLLAEVRYVERERLLGYARVGWNFLGGVGGVGLAPLNYSALSVHLGAGVEFPGLLENLIGQNHWSVSADLYLGFGDADRNPATTATVWMPGAFFELEKRGLFGWGDRWAGFGPQGDYHDDARPQNYHIRTLDARVGLYVDIQNGQDTGWIKVDAAVGFRYNVVGPRIPEHPFKETRVVYLSEEYLQQVLHQRELREQRMKQSGASP